MKRAIQIAALLFVAANLYAQGPTNAELSKRLEEQAKAIENLQNIIKSQQELIENTRSTMLNSAKILDDLLSKVNERIDKLEGKPRSEIGSPSGDWMNLSNWRKLKVGMSEKAVKELLGEPERISAGSFTRWYYFNRTPPVVAHVVFYQGKVDSFEEPSSVPDPNR